MQSGSFFMYDAVFIGACVLLAVLGAVLRSPFRYPYYVHTFDVSGRRNPDIEELIDEFIIAGGFDEIRRHHDGIGHWKRECEDRISDSILREYSINNR